MADSQIPSAPVEMPEFMQYSPADIVAMGRERSASPERIAKALFKHQDNLENWGRQNAGAKFFNGARKLDADTGVELDKIWKEQQGVLLREALPDARDQQELAYQLQAGGFDPDTVEERFQPVVQQMMQRPEGFTLSREQYHGGKINAGGRDLAHYSMRRGNDGVMDVGLIVPDPKDPSKDVKESLRVPYATPEDVQAEIDRRTVQRDQAQVGRDYYAKRAEADPETKVLAENVGRFAGEVRNWQKQIDDLSAGGQAYLMGERVREELKKPEWRGKVGEYGGWAELMKGIESAGITSAGLGARIGQATGDAGADRLMKQLNDLRETQGLRHGGSTRRALEGGLLNDSIVGAQQSAGQMLPFMAGGLLTRGGTALMGASEEMAAQQAGRLGVAGAGMGVSAVGGAELDTQRKIDAALAAGDTKTAERLAAGRDLHAVLTGLTEAAVERLGAAQALNVGGRGLKNTVGNMLQEGVEEPLTGVVQRAVVDRAALGERPDVFGSVPQEMLTGIMAGAPVVGASESVNLMTGKGSGTNGLPTSETNGTVEDGSLASPTAEQRARPDVEVVPGPEEMRVNPLSMTPGPVINGLEEHVSDLTEGDVADLEAALPQMAAPGGAAEVDSLSFAPPPNSGDPSLSPDLRPGNLPSDVQQLPEFAPAEAADRVRRLETSLRARGELPSGQKLLPAAAGELPAGTAPAYDFARAFAGLFGRRVVALKGLRPDSFGGVTNSKIQDTVFFNPASPRAAHSLVGHEMLHHLEVAHPDLFQRLDDVLKPDLVRWDQAKKNYAAYAQGEGGDLNVRREVYGDFMGESLSDPQFWDRLSERDAGTFLPLARAVWQWFRGVINALRSRGWEASQYFKDVQRAQATLADSMVEFAKRERGVSPQDAQAAVQDVLTGGDNFFQGLQQENEGPMGPGRPAQTRSRMARPDVTERWYETRADSGVRGQASAWLDSRQLGTAINELGGADLPDGILSEDVKQQAIGQALRRAMAAMDQGDEFARSNARIMAHKASRLYQDAGRESARALRQRAVVNHELSPFAPILAAESLLIDRADAVMDKRFEGGAAGGAAKADEVAKKSGVKAGEEVASKLDGSRQPDSPVQARQRERISQAHRTAQRLLDNLAKRYSDPLIFEERNRVVNAMAELYRQHVKSPLLEQEFVRRAVAIGAPEGLAGTLWEASKLEINARAIIAQEALRKPLDRLLAKDSPQLAKMLNELRKKMYPGMNWRAIFEQLPVQQRERQRAVYVRLRKDERLRNLTSSEVVKLTNELDKAWQRERRRVFVRELKKVGVLGEKAPADLQKAEQSTPKLLRAINLGVMTAETFREAVAPQYGLRMLTQVEAAGLRKMAEDAYALPQGLLRNKKLAELLDKIQKQTRGGWGEILNNYWVAAVLSGLRTMFDTFMSIPNGLLTTGINTAMVALRSGQRKQALEALQQYWQGLLEGGRESLQILKEGDYSFLKRFNDDLKKALDGDSTFRPLPLGESLWKDGNAFQKYGLAPIMLWTGRILAAADHINNTATTAGAMATARALHPEIYNRQGFTDQQRADAKQQALREVTGGVPAKGKEVAIVSARAREILYAGMTPETYAEASFIGDQAAYQNDPVGLLGGIYKGMSSGLGAMERLIQDAADKVGADGPAAAYLRGLLMFMSGALRSALGAKFIRFGANFGNDMLAYMPGTRLLSPVVAGFESTQSQRQLLLGKNIVGLLAGLAVASYFLGKDDDEDGLHIEGPWLDLNPQEKAQRRAAGYEPFTIWHRGGDRVRRLSYRQLPIAGLLASIAHMQDRQRFAPDKWKAEGLAGHLLAAGTVGAFQVKEVGAIQVLTDLLGASALGNPEEQFFEKLRKKAVDYTGAFIPTLAKDLDALNDPRRYKPATVMEEIARHVPVLRRMVNDGRPQLTILGEVVPLDRTPWSRQYTSIESGAANRMLGNLLARGFNLPEPDTTKKVRFNGAWVTLRSLGSEVEYKYQKKVGEGYREWLSSSEGQKLLTTPGGPDAIQREISRRADRIKSRAALLALGR